MTAKTPTQLKTEITTSFPDNTVGAITPAIMRSFQNDMVDSLTAGGTALNVVSFGAVGDGNTDDSAAFSAYIAYCASTLVSPPNRTIQSAVIQSGFLIPPGHYKVTGGFTQNAGNILFIAEPDTVTIELTTNDWFLTVPNEVPNTYVKGVNWLGGKGYFNYQFTGNNVQGFHVWEDNSFDNYTVCAIGNNATDMPTMKVRRNIFCGPVGGGSIGMAFGGYLDDLDVTDNTFLRNKYHMKLGPYLGSSIHIERNSFIAFTPGVRSADIWFVPNTVDAGGVNSGAGTTLERNKFGNESQQAGDIRIIYAIEDAGSGTDRLTRSHSTAWQASGAYVTDILFAKNYIEGVAGTAPFMKSYINFLDSIHWDDDNMYGSSYTYLCEFASSVTDEDAYITRTWNLQIGEGSPGIRPFSIAVSNRMVGEIIDEYGQMAGADQIYLPGQLDDVGYTNLFAGSDAIGALTAFDATASATADSMGFDLAAQVTMSSADGMVHVNSFTATANRMAWLEFDYRLAGTLPVSSITVKVLNVISNKIAFLSIVNLQANWKTFCSSFIIPDASDMTNWDVYLIGNGYSAGVATKFDIARVNVYHANARQNSNNLRTLGAGTWNTEHIIMGVASGQIHLWVDGSGRLKIKVGSAPVNDADGTIVGTQS